MAWISTAGKTYSFSAWAATLYTDNAELEFLVDGQSVGTLVVGQGGWLQFSVDWTATSSKAVVLRINNTSSGFYEAYAIDDLVFAEKQAAGAHEFKYDYRSRRYYRSTPDTPNMYSVFDGGLSIQEHETASADLTRNPLTPGTIRTEYVRGEGMGGGVGGMVYSIKNGGTTGNGVRKRCQSYYLSVFIR